MPRFEVMFRTEPALADEIDAALEAAEIEKIADYGSSPPGTPETEYRPDTHVVAVDADDADKAGNAVKQAIQGKAAAFVLVSVSPEQ